MADSPPRALCSLLASLFLATVACSDGEVGDTADSPAVDSEETGDTPLGLEVSELVSLGAVDVGDPAPTGPLGLSGQSLTPLTIAVNGPFTVEGALDPVDGARTLEVRFTGALDVPANHVGEIVLSADDMHYTVPVGASVVDPALPNGLTWNSDALGSSTYAAMPSAPYPTDGGAWTDPTVYLYVPNDADTPIATVTHLHGHNAVLADMLATKQLPELWAAASRNALVIAPQGPVGAASGDFGKLMDPGGHADLVRDCVALAYREGLIDLPASEGVVLSSHSGGYSAAASIIEHGGLPVDAVHLYDSLYGYVPQYEAFARAGGELRSNYTTSGGTATNNQALTTALSDVGVAAEFSDGTLRSEPVIIGWTPATHGAVMRDERNLQRWLEASLPPSPHAPPQLLSTEGRDGSVTVRWRDEGLEATVWGSSDGDSWSALGAGFGAATVPASPWIRVRFGGEDASDARTSDAYPGNGGDWLVVDGFDRFLGGSYVAHTHPFAAWLGEALPSASGASNEAVAEGLVDLSAYDHVLWILGDESTDDRTFTDAEQATLRSYLAGGGKLVVSGAELGYATETAFLAELGIAYVSDDAGTTTAGGWRFGIAYPEDFPDVLSGDSTVWSYDTGGGAAVQSGSVIAVGFALETLHPDDRDVAIAELIAALDG